MTKITIEQHYASGNRTSWAKTVTGLDRTQKGAKAFIGDYVREGEHSLPEGTIILEVRPYGSAKHPEQYAAFYKVDSSAENGLVNLTEQIEDENERNKDWKPRFASILDEAEGYLNAAKPELAENSLAAISDADLLAEIKRRGLVL